MDPAFSSPRQAAGFSALLLIILLAPVIATKSLLPPREAIYNAFPFQKQIFEEKGDIDIAFMGSSRMGCAIDPAYVQQQLSTKLGRQTVVRNITWTWNGFDALYFIAEDLLQHRKVHMIVLHDMNHIDGHDQAHHQAFYWFRLADNGEALAGLPIRSKASFYASAIIGMPLNLVYSLRQNLPALPTTTQWYYSSTDYTPLTTTSASDVSLYSNTTTSDFHFEGASLAEMQKAFVKKIGALARKYNVQLVFLHLSDRSDLANVINEDVFWPDLFHTNLPMVGIPPSKLFRELSEGDVQELFHNPTHFNQNGQRYFTRLVTPSLITIYEDQLGP